MKPISPFFSYQFKFRQSCRKMTAFQYVLASIFVFVYFAQGSASAGTITIPGEPGQSAAIDWLTTIDGKSKSGSFRMNLISDSADGSKSHFTYKFPDEIEQRGAPIKYQYRVRDENKNIVVKVNSVFFANALDFYTPVVFPLFDPAAPASPVFAIMNFDDFTVNSNIINLRIGEEFNIFNGASASLQGITFKDTSGVDLDTFDLAKFDLLPMYSGVVSISGFGTVTQPVPEPDSWLMALFGGLIGLISHGRGKRWHMLAAFHGRGC